MAVAEAASLRRRAPKALMAARAHGPWGGGGARPRPRAAVACLALAAGRGQGGAAWRRESCAASLCAARVAYPVTSFAHVPLLSIRFGCPRLTVRRGISARDSEAICVPRAGSAVSVGGPRSQRSHRAAKTGEARSRGGAGRPEARPAEAPAARRREPEPARSRLAVRGGPGARARSAPPTRPQLAQ